MSAGAKAREPEHGVARAGSWRKHHGALAVAALVALALRLWHIAHGLPDFVEEAIPLRRAFDMWGWRAGHADLNPHLFHYPSLSIYLQFALQHLHYWTGRLTG